MIKYKHKITGQIAESHLGEWYTVESSKLHKTLIENTNDWEEVTDKPLFTTEDRVVITDKNTVLYGCNTKGECLLNWQAKVVGDAPPSEKWFSTSKARHEYIINHKPMFSIEDMRNLDTKRYGIETNTNDSIGINTRDVIAMAKEKLKETTV